MIKDLNINREDDNIADKSKVGKKLSDSTMRRVIILVLSMILGIIIFNPNFYFQEITSLEYGIKMFNDFSFLDDPGVNITFDAYVNNHIVKLFLIFRIQLRLSCIYR